MNSILSPNERAYLRQRALVCTVAAIRGRPAAQALPEAPETLEAPRGVFVSIYVAEELRGCMGSIRGREGLLTDTERLAADAAIRDERFRPVHPDELPRLRVNLSVLTVPWAVADAGAVEAGRHGVVVRHGEACGVLLPQVAQRYGWDGRRLVREAAVKAGIPEAARIEMSIEVFETEEF